MKYLALWLLPLLSVLPAQTDAATLLSIDLSVTDQVTIVAEAGLASADLSGSDGIGIYLPNFFATPGSGFSILNASGNFSSANETTDNTARLFQFNGDTGLNIYTFVTGPTITFSDGTTAFTGSATWNLTPGLYAEFVNAPGAGLIFFPADDANDIVGQTAIGEFTTSNAAPVPVPASLLLLASALFGFGIYGRMRARRDGKADTNTRVPLAA